MMATNVTQPAATGIMPAIENPEAVWAFPPAMAHQIGAAMLDTDFASLERRWINRDLAVAAGIRRVDSLPTKGRRFLYFNCCELGAQQAREAARNSYYGGFAEGILSVKACNETICNRWPVTFEWACRIASEFYKQKPRTAQGRAGSLLTARLRVRHEMNQRQGEQQHDPTWLAPVHLWVSG
jgi:hypothetical protein